MQTHHKLPMRLDALIGLVVVLAAGLAHAREEILAPYAGPVAKGVDASTLNGKVMTGYQGWFNCEGDGAGLGWTHWTNRRSVPFQPGNVSVDLWPDTSEYDQDELYPTGFRYTDGTTAHVYSSYNRKTVLRHFQWMRDYGIDGAFIQRFAHGLRKPDWTHHKNSVLIHAREGANRFGRTYAVMYDLTGLPDEKILRVYDDLQMLCTTMELTRTPAYQRHNGKPLIAIWGVGFNEDIKDRNSLSACKALIQKIKAAGFSVMLGIPTGWRAQVRDALEHPELHDVLRLADVLSPWTVGRYQSIPDVNKHGDEYWKKDIAWAGRETMDYMPVIFPGFSWYNNKGEGFNRVPRLRGEFFWSQVVACKKAGADMIYIAMFDEMDEGTAIFKCADNPPTGNGGTFLTMEGVPSDFYLRMAGIAGKVIRGEMLLSETMPLDTVLE